MPSTSDAATCQVVLLVPQASERESILCEASAERLSLPTVQVEAEPPTASIQRAIEARLGWRPTLLRASAVRWHENWDAATMFVEVEPMDGEPAAGLCWTRIDAQGAARVHPESARPSVAGWLNERVNGWSTLRPQWSRPGWLSEASAWMVDEMRAAGFRDPQPPRIQHLWGVSVILTADSLDGPAYLKASGDRFRHEGTVTQALAARSPGLLPDVIVVNAERGWMLMRDFGATDLGEQATDTWHLGLDALADLQLAWLGRESELLGLGAENRPLDALAAWIGATEEDGDLMTGLADEERDQWVATLGEYVDACWELAEVGVAPTLVHGDFHPWNVAVRDGRTLIFDWTDASLSHPFVDLATYVMRTSDHAARIGMVRRYLDRWRPLPADYEKVVDLSLVVGALYQAQTYAHLLPTVLPEDLSDLRGGDADWIRRAMRFRRDGLAARY